ncbi:MAG: AmmeMemoRadiSam system protein B [Rhodothermales bacterium]|nr:AmmeMemoRadiSam system protein B [Rhodothermales bacterium]
MQKPEITDGHAEASANGLDKRSHSVDLLQDAEIEHAVSEIFAVAVPASGVEAGPLSARIYKQLEGRRYDTVVIIAAGGEEAKGRINIWSSDTYGSGSSAVEVNDRMRNELCDEDDDIFVSDDGHFLDDGIHAQLPLLRESIGEFRVVPLVMGDETPDICRELGSALSEVSYNESTLIVAVVDAEGGASGWFGRFDEHLAAGDVSNLFGMIMSGDMRVRGGGGLMAAMIAAGARGAIRPTLLAARPAGNESETVGVIFAH